MNNKLPIERISKNVNKWKELNLNLLKRESTERMINDVNRNIFLAHKNKRLAKRLNKIEMKKSFKKAKHLVHKIGPKNQTAPYLNLTHLNCLKIPFKLKYLKVYFVITFAVLMVYLRFNFLCNLYKNNYNNLDWNIVNKDLKNNFILLDGCISKIISSIKVYLETVQSLPLFLVFYGTSGTGKTFFSQLLVNNLKSFAFNHDFDKFNGLLKKREILNSFSTIVKQDVTGSIDKNSNFYLYFIDFYQSELQPASNNEIIYLLELYNSILLQINSKYKCILLINLTTDAHNFNATLNIPKSGTQIDANISDNFKFFKFKSFQKTNLVMYANHLIKMKSINLNQSRIKEKIQLIINQISQKYLIQSGFRTFLRKLEFNYLLV